MSTIKIWLGDLGQYNEGKLVGEWLALPMDEDELAGKLSQYSQNNRGDYFIADHECDIPKLVRETSDPFALNLLAERLEKLSDYDLKRVSYLIEDGSTPDEALENYGDLTFYEGMKLTDVAQELVEDGCFGIIPKGIVNYIDYEAIARDLRYDGYEETKEGVFHRY